MKNIHLQHPEDSILTGDLSALNAFINPSHLSVKFDGRPAIVWGTHPQNGKTFVGTKSVFNKKKIKINYTVEDIERNHGDRPELVMVLTACLENLYPTNYIYQGDFIGFGGGQVEFTPNTVDYVFPDVINETIVVAPHTEYYADKESGLPNAIGRPLIRDITPKDDYFKTFPDEVGKCLYVQPKAWVTGKVRHQRTNNFEQIHHKVQFAKQMAQAVTFAEPDKVGIITQMLNSCIKLDLPILDEEFENICDPRLISLWKLVRNIKEEAMSYCRDDSCIESYINGEYVGGEGYVIHNHWGTYKLVYRHLFSHANFNNLRYSK